MASKGAASVTRQNEAVSLHIDSCQDWFNPSSIISLVEFSKGVKTFDGVVDDDGLAKHLETNSDGDPPSLRAIFLKWKSRSRRLLELSSRGMHILCSALNLPLDFVEGVFNDSYMLPLGYGYFNNRAADGTQRSLDIFYEYGFGLHSGKAFVFRQFDHRDQSLTYLCINSPQNAPAIWLSDIERQVPGAAIGKSFTLDAIIAGESLKWLTEELSKLRLRLLEYEFRQHLRAPKETTQDLHNMAQLWHILLGNLSDFHGWVVFVLQSQERILQNDKDTPDRMRLELLLTKAVQLKRWAAIYKDRTNIRINLSFHLSTQVDNETNFRISNYTSIIARDTQQDSSSMITIAAVTMFFLPGTFISAIFSMVFFNVDRDGAGKEEFWVSGRWWYYIAVTLPLTLSVFVVWLLWRKARMRSHEKANAKLMGEKDASS